MLTLLVLGSLSELWETGGRVVQAVGLMEEKRVDPASATGECPGL